MQRDWKVGDKILHKDGTYFGLLVSKVSGKDDWFKCIIFKIDVTIQANILTPEKNFEVAQYI